MRKNSSNKSKPIEQLSQSLADIFADLINEAGDKPLDKGTFEGLDKKIESGLTRHFEAPQLRKNN